MTDTTNADRQHYIPMVDEAVLAPESQIIARYFSMEKAIRLLKDPGIWFSAFDAQEDFSEGAFFPLYIPPQSNIGVEHRSLLLNHQRRNSFSFLSCWTDFSGGENERLWFNYAQNEGICAITTVGQLQNALKNDHADRPIPAVKVDYITDEKLKRCAPNSYKSLPHIWNPDDSSQRCRIFPETVKRAQYAYEQEIRFIICSSNKSRGRLQKFCDLSSRSENLPFEKILLRGSKAMELQSYLRNTFMCKVERSEMQQDASIFN